MRDDDHVLAVFREGKCFGAIGQSNYSTLRWREPVYRSLRELVMSYFDGYFSTSGERSLRSYTAPIDLRRFGAFGWRTKDGAMRRIAGFLTKAKHIPVIDAAQARRLHRVDRRLYAAGSLGADPRGLYDAGAYVDE